MLVRQHRQIALTDMCLPQYLCGTGTTSCAVASKSWELAPRLRSPVCARWWYTAEARLCCACWRLPLVATKCRCRRLLRRWLLLLLLRRLRRCVVLRRWRCLLMGILLLRLPCRLSRLRLLRVVLSPGSLALLLLEGGREGSQRRPRVSGCHKASTTLTR